MLPEGILEDQVLSRGSGGDTPCYTFGSSVLQWSGTKYDIRGDDDVTTISWEQMDDFIGG